MAISLGILTQHFQTNPYPWIITDPRGVQWRHLKIIHFTWVISHVPIFHITQPLGINGLFYGYYFWWCPIAPSHGTFTNPCFKNTFSHGNQPPPSSGDQPSYSDRSREAKELHRLDVKIQIQIVTWRSGFVWKCRVPLKPMVLLIIIPMKNG